MKILQINALYGYKSTGTIVRDIGDAVERSGGEAYYAYQSARGDVKNGYVVGNKPDWKAHALLSRVFGKQAYFSRHATKKLIKHIENVSPDVVHLHNLHSNFINLNILLDFLGKRDIPTVVTMHDCWYFTGKCYHYQDVGCDKFTNDCKGCPKWRANPPSLFFDRAAVMLADRKKYFSKIPNLHFVGCSDWICQEARRGFLKDMNISRIYNGVDTDIFKPTDRNAARAEYSIPQSARVFMGMANKWLAPENDGLAQRTAESIGENNVLLLVGCSEDDKAKISSLGLKNVVAIGYVSGREALAKIYGMADVFVNATHADTLPTVNMESICCGTPVVTYNSCGSPELILSGCGKVVARGDQGALIEATLSVTDRIDGASLAAAREAFDKNKCYEKYIELYKDMIKRN